MNKGFIRDIFTKNICRLSLCISLLGTVLILASCGAGKKEAISLTEESGLETDSSSESTVSEDVSNKDNDGGNREKYTDDRDDANSIFVYVTGMVKKPGVYRLVEGARIYEVIEKAGGMNKKAAKSCVNLAQIVADGQHIHVMSEEEFSASNVAVSESGGTIQATDGLININTATAEELMQLPGIGESKANSIVAYRDEEGDFSSIEDIMQVPGIKEGAFAKIKSFIKV